MDAMLGTGLVIGCLGTIFIVCLVGILSGELELMDVFNDYIRESTTRQLYIMRRKINAELERRKGGVNGEESDEVQR